MQKYLSTTWRLWKLLRPFHKEFYLQLFNIILTQGFTVVTVLFAAGVIDNIVKTDFTTAYKYILGWFLISMLRVILGSFFDKRAQNNLDFKIQQYLEEYSFNNIFKLTPDQFLEDHSQLKLQVVNRGENSIENIINSFVLTIIPTITQITFALVAIAYYSPSISLLAIVTLTIAVTWSIKFTNYHRPYIKQDTDNWDIQRKVRAEAFAHLTTIKILSTYNTYLKKYLKNRMEYIDYKVFTWNKSLDHGQKRWAFFTVSRALSSLALVYQASIAAITVGNVYAIWMWLNDAYNNIFNIIRQLRQLPLRYIELEKYLDIIDKKPNFEESGKSVFIDGDIVFEKVSFRYPKSESFVIEDINLKINRGEKIAFVGHSGSGKTTITKLLLRSYDYKEGSIKIGNLELKDINADSLRRQIGYVEQHVDLLDDTIKNNILLSVDEKTLNKWEVDNIVDSKLEEVARLARIDEFYHRLGEKKFDTEIGERGVKLSGGERQRIGIARAIIKNPEILIFDEATSALDTVNEKYIKEAIDNVSRGRTTIIIAHRLSTVQDADKIVVMDRGRVVGVGRHKDLMLECKEYIDLVEHQELT